jgi:hypothetical protein
MPLPETLAALIRQMGDKFDPAAARKEHADNVDMWRLYLDLLEMDSTKLGRLIEKHDGESADKEAMRRKLAAIFNYVPAIVRMTVNYLHAEQPTYEVADQSLRAFLDNCNGAGLSFVEYVRRQALPLSLVLGWVDVLVQNPESPDGLFVTAADQQQSTESFAPRVHTITPLDRTNWSAKQTHEYSWVRFRDLQNEIVLPFINDPKPEGESYITVSGFVRSGEESLTDDTGREVGFWVRSYRNVDNPKQKEWLHDGDWLPTRRCPIASLFYAQSIDPEPGRRHFGISKVSQIAILTRKIIQLLSWSDEQVLSNLAIFVLPGEQPTDPKDPTKKLDTTLTPFTVIWLKGDPKISPMVLQGDTGHISIIWEIIDAYIREILRLAFLIGSSAEAEQITSGVQGVVARTELFQELSDLAGALDRFALETLALVASLINDEDVTVQGLIERYKLTVAYNKGNYTIDPLTTILDNTERLVSMFKDIAPAMAEAAYRQAAQAALYNEDARRTEIFSQIRQNFAEVTANDAALRNAIVANATAAAANPAPAIGTPAAPISPLPEGG